MASIRALRPITRQAVRVVSRPSRVNVGLVSRRGLSTDAPVLYSAHANVFGARTGHVDGENLKIDLTMAKALGGTGDEGKTNPEELFAAGYGACFQSAMNASAPGLGLKMPKDPHDSIIETTVHLIGDMKKLDMGIRVDMKIKVKGIPKADLEKLVEKTKTVCPYSRAIEGNVVTNTEIVEMN